MGRKRCIELTESEQITLREGIKYHAKHEFRRCCQALLWSAKGWSVKAIATELEVCQVSVSSWLTNWQNQGLVGLMRQKGQGRRSILSVTNTAHQQALKQAVSTHYQDAGRIKTDLEKALGQSMSRDTVKRFLKKTITLGTDFGEPPNLFKIR
ncbi:helix-turn-helix domain-containing protein [Spirosoma sp. HMF3257]|uniref:Helix-turn-helix domain-containing protein n=1 Tax=Spirosoma telluris TaxID=2183553 RepID=A0A327NGB9_9BACT|nr:helix-turn-helix domain-containing protein [Spirosoma telluris]MVM37420.1 helix-turn-helix domain-containing protein [Spirosoma telluris]RAI73319.1 helix-turn-helix domain-containing protein [Spirosoma telluris]RAI74134.1 helix-turn-helix domain-containing protein [Spirosoma telluris]